MNAESLTSNGALEIAHALPGRMRLRWRGAGEPPASLLEQFRALPGVGRVEYRAASRSVVVHADAARGSPEPAPRRSRPARRAGSGAPEIPAVEPQVGSFDVDALLTVGLVATWLADLFATRAIRLITLPLLVLAGITAYRLYERRQRAAEF